MRKRRAINIEWLEEHGAPLAFREWFNNTLNAKVKIGALVKILQRLEKPDWEGWLLIQEIDVTEVAIEGGADISVCDNLVLRWSVQNGHVELIKLLVEKGADISVCDSLVLRWSVQNGHVELIKLLVKKGADLRSFNDLLLFLAAEKGHLEMVKYLLVNELDIHAQSDCALRWAVKNADLELAKFLKGKGANVDGLLKQAKQAKKDKDEKAIAFLKNLKAKG